MINLLFSPFQFSTSRQQNNSASLHPSTCLNTTHYSAPHPIFPRLPPKKPIKVLRFLLFFRRRPMTLHNPHKPTWRILSEDNL